MKPKPTAKHTVAVDRILRDYGMQIGEITKQALNDRDATTAAKESYQTEQKAKAELGKLFMDEIIGADEVDEYYPADRTNPEDMEAQGVTIGRNQLRAELRQRITDTFGVKE